MASTSGSTGRASYASTYVANPVVDLQSARDLQVEYETFLRKYTAIIDPISNLPMITLKRYGDLTPIDPRAYIDPIDRWGAGYSPVHPPPCPTSPPRSSGPSSCRSASTISTC